MIRVRIASGRISSSLGKKEIMNCFLNNLLLGNVLVIVYIRSFPLCVRYTRLSLRAPPASSDTLLTITLERVNRYVKIKPKIEKKKFRLKSTRIYFQISPPKLFLGVNALIE